MRWCPRQIRVRALVIIIGLKEDGVNRPRKKFLKLLRPVKNSRLAFPRAIARRWSAIAQAEDRLHTPPNGVSQTCNFSRSPCKPAGRACPAAPPSPPAGRSVCAPVAMSYGRCLGFRGPEGCPDAGPVRRVGLQPSAGDVQARFPNSAAATRQRLARRWVHVPSVGRRPCAPGRIRDYAFSTIPRSGVTTLLWRGGARHGSVDLPPGN